MRINFSKLINGNIFPLKAKIKAYRGFRNERYAYIYGQLSRQIPIDSTKDTNTAFKNLIQMFFLFMGKAISQASITLTYLDDVHDLKTDNMGMINVKIPYACDSPVAEEWTPFDLRWQSDRDSTTHSTISELLYPTGYKYGIISDIDDTIITSHASRPLKKITTLLFKNFLSRKSFEDAAKFYQLLHHSTIGGGKNPFFYVSSSQWVLYDMLERFCNHHGFPKGVFLLRKVSWNLMDIIKGRLRDHSHKILKIEQVLKAYPDMNFVLIGDNGQQDAYLYASVAKKFPDRILVIYLREAVARRASTIRDFAEVLPVEMIQVRNFEQAIQHALSLGIIDKHMIE